ncbi:MAG: hypothetical protein U9N35_03725 [Euryarchaeota archaeon]|nr:hypothetical protein [Euryarchaeota archaeon]
MTLSEVVNEYISKTTGLKEYCDRCLRTERWDNSPVLMVVDAAFDSVGLNYFSTTAPKVMEFKKEFVDEGRVRSFAELRSVQLGDLEHIWANKRSWNVAQSVASYFDDLGNNQNLDDKEAFRKWAADSELNNWREDPIGRINGVGINTYQYLRMMGGVDTSMPDKVVKRVIEEILERSGTDMPTAPEKELIITIEKIAEVAGCRPIELCWMTWLVQSEGDKIRMEKYKDLLDKI